MSFIQQSSPHAHSATSTPRVMLTVAAATLPGLAALVYFFGFGPLINVTLSITFCVGLEALILKLRKRPIGFYLTDYSALVTGLLLGLALPPYCPWWLLVVGAFFAIIVAKQLYGGLGYNPFNPAMVGYVVLLISFPVPMTQWPAPAELSETSIGLSSALAQVFTGGGLDAYTGATPLDAFRQAQGLTVEAIYQQPIFSSGAVAGVGWEWVNLGFLIGGLFLLSRKVFTWHAPVAMLASLCLCSFIFYDGSSTSGAPPLLHLFSGATMLGAFFIVTDPVSSAVSNKGRLIYGAAIGVLIYTIRTWGSYPDAVAFAVLLMNFAHLLSITTPYRVPTATINLAVPRKKRNSDARKAIGKNSLILALFALCTAGVLAGTYQLTKDKILASERAVAQKALLEIVPEERHDNDLLTDTLAIDTSAEPLLGKVSDKSIHIARQDTKTIAAIIPATAADGYSGDIDLIVGVNVDGSLAGVRVLSHNETPGLGDKVDLRKSDWVLSFKGKSLNNPTADQWKVKKDGGQFDQFTGATITPRAVVAQVKQALEYFEANKERILKASTSTGKLTTIDNES